MPAFLSVTLILFSLTIVSCAKCHSAVAAVKQVRAANSTFMQAVTKNRYGKGGQEYWIFEPDSPKPRTAPVIVFLHGWGGMNPLYYGAWLDHLVKRGNIVDLSALPGQSSDVDQRLHAEYHQRS